MPCCVNKCCSLFTLSVSSLLKSQSEDKSSFALIYYWKNILINWAVYFHRTNRHYFAVSSETNAAESFTELDQAKEHKHRLLFQYPSLLPPSLTSLSGPRVWLCMSYRHIPLILTASRTEKSNYTLRTTWLRPPHALSPVQEVLLIRMFTVSTWTRLLMMRESRKTVQTLVEETGYGNTFGTTWRRSEPHVPKWSLRSPYLSIAASKVHSWVRDDHLNH